MVSEIDFEVGFNGMCFDCSDSPYVYGPAGHVITANLSIVNDKQIRQLRIKDIRIGNRIIQTGIGFNQYLRMR